MINMSKPYVVRLGKFVRRVSRLRGGGSALPGLFVEKIDAGFVANTLAQLPMGVAVISGTNGKTTTTKTTVEILENAGLKVFTNRSGSNFTRGVAASLLGEIDNHGRLHHDIAVLELDEAHAVRFVESVRPRYTLLLNVMRDQLDRFGEIDRTAELLSIVAEKTTDTVIVNREDPRLRRLAERLTDKNVVFFGINEKLRKFFPNDDDIYGNSSPDNTTRPQAAVELESFENQQATFKTTLGTIRANLQLKGAYNVFNTAAALTLANAVLGETADINTLTAALNKVTPAFGRGEVINVNGNTIELVLVKNPAGFRLSLASFPPENHDIMLAINDNYADGRDMSWLWDVNFQSLRDAGVTMVSGSRAYDMALRLKYDDVPFQRVETNLKRALKQFINGSARPKRIFCTYTAMLTVRRQLAGITTVEKIS